MSDGQTSKIGVVVIGRNEGERLRRCLASVIGRTSCVVYVDSGSTDGSVALARSMGAEVVELDAGGSFTAARARNEGWRRLMKVQPDATLVQFVDGDCEVVAGWLEAAGTQLLNDEGLAIVCGRRRERHRERSLYNRLCDMEWNTPVGIADACGGDAMMRLEALRQVGGFNPSLICGEEPELCVRLRQHGWTIRRIDREMTLHDAAMTRFSQWWRRTVRSGWFVAEGAALHGRPPQRHCTRQMWSIWLYGAALPLSAILAAPPTMGISLALAGGLYARHGWKVYRNRRRYGDPPRDAGLYATFCTLGKTPEAIGQLRYWIHRLLGRDARLIEYKGAPALGEAR